MRKGPLRDLTLGKWAKILNNWKTKEYIKNVNANENYQAVRVSSNLKILYYNFDFVFDRNLTTTIEIIAEMKENYNKINSFRD